MIFSVDLVEPINCWNCTNTATYIEITDPRFDPLGFLDEDLPVIYACHQHLSTPRSAYKPIYDCLYRNCGPEHCDYPTCKDFSVPDQPTAVPRSITRDAYLNILKTYGFDPDEIVHMFLDHRGITAELYKKNEFGQRVIIDDHAQTYETFVPVKG